MNNTTIEKYGFKRVNNSTWRKGNWTLQSGYTNDGVTLYDRIFSTKKAYKLCIDGKYSQMITNEELLAELMRGREVDAFEEYNCYACQGEGCYVCNGYGMLTE